MFSLALLQRQRLHLCSQTCPHGAARLHAAQEVRSSGLSEMPRRGRSTGAGCLCWISIVLVGLPASLISYMSNSC